jgi:bacillithiol biosynthesis cysteine-adding enzyme BshC
VSVPRVLTVPLGGPPLARAAAAGSAPDGWYQRPPASAEGWRAVVERARSRGPKDWIETLRPAMSPSGAAAVRLQEVAGGAGAVVTTGQQPALFGGPVYVWSKALAALALADALREATGIPVAPVFWAATDDADFAEASYATIAVPGGTETLRIAASHPDGTSMSAVPLGDVRGLLPALARGAGSASYRQALDLVRDAYAPDETVGSAFVRLLRGLLEPLGIAVLDASHPSVRQAMFPALRPMLERAAAIERAGRERVDALRAAGFEPQVSEVAGLSLVFEYAGGTRRRIPVATSGAVASAATPGALGPNVLSRPLVERALLPTATYVAGPGELAYFAQVSAVAAALGTDLPMVTPRWSVTIVEPHVDRILQRRGLSIDELADPHAAETRLARGLLPEPVSETLRELREAVERHTAVLFNFEETRTPRLLSPKVVQGARASLEHRLQRLERRYLAAMKREEAEIMRDVGTARGALYPGGHRQERALAFLPLLARHGPPLVEAMRAEARRYAARLVGGVAAGAATPTPAGVDE